MDQLWLWVGFNAFVLAMLALDLGVGGGRAPGADRDPLFLWTGAATVVVALLVLVVGAPEEFVTRILLLLVAGAGVLAVARGLRGRRAAGRGGPPGR